MNCEINFDQKIYNSMDQDLLDLLKRLLEKDPKARILSEDAFNHRYFKKIDIEKSQPKIEA